MTSNGPTPEPERADLSRIATAALLVLVFLGAAALRLPGLARPFDQSAEGWTGSFYGCQGRNCLRLRSAVPLLDPIPGAHAPVPYVNHPPLPAWTVAAMFAAFGETEWAARLPFLLASLLAVLYAYRLGRRLGSRTLGVVTAAFLAACPVAVFYGSQVEHTGSLLLLAVLGTTLAHLDFYDTPGPWRGLRLAAWATFLFVADWPGALAFFALQGLAFWVYPARRRLVGLVTVLGLGACGLVVAWLVAVGPQDTLTHLLQSAYPRPFRSVTDAQGQAEGRAFTAGGEMLLRYFEIHTNLIGLGLAVPALGWVVVTAGAWRVRSRVGLPGPGRRAALLPAGLLGFAALFYLVGGGGHFQHDSWSHPVAGAYALAAAAGLEMLGLWPLVTLWLALLIVAVQLGTLGAYCETVTARTGGPAPTAPHAQIRALRDRIPEADPVLVVDRTQWPTLPYYTARSLLTCDRLEDVPAALRVPGHARPWQQYLHTHKILLTGDPAPEAAGRPGWLLAPWPGTLPLGSRVAVSGGWQLARLPAALPEGAPPSTTPPSPVASRAHATRAGAGLEALWPWEGNLVGWYQGVALTCLLGIGLLLRPPVSRIRWVVRAADRLNRSPALGTLAVGTVAVAVAVGIVVLSGEPVPFCQDELSHLFAADTFAAGRCTNPTPPCWPHFETVHVMVRPTWASKYPPAQGLFLAVGQVVTGRPIAGIWLSLGLAAAAVYWMLRAWVPPRWALLGGLIAVLHPAIQCRWGYSFMGGTVAMLGSALVFGALPRLVRPARTAAVLPALLLGVGIVVLANSRPCEGLVVCLPAAVVLGVGLVSASRCHGTPWGRRVLPILLVLLAGAAAMGWYNFRVTGSVWCLPYAAHEAEYARAPTFLWQSPRSVPASRHETLRDVHEGWEMEEYEKKRSWVGVWQGFGVKLRLLREFFLQDWLLIVPVVALPWVVRQRWMRLALLACGLLIGLFFFYTFPGHRYAAPLAPLVIVLFVQCVRQLRLWRFHSRPVGRFLARGTLLAGLLGVVPAVLDHTIIFRGLHDADRKELAEVAKLPDTRALVAGYQRRDVTGQLSGAGGQHLVLVRYLAARPPLFDWVYNRADLNQATIVWARELTPDENQELLTAFRGRRVWLLEVGAGAPRLYPWERAPARLRD
jgi:4-amino-4-deoxy-L-arabinose transferase-like glycosyltransferase